MKDLLEDMGLGSFWDYEWWERLLLVPMLVNELDPKGGKWPKMSGAEKDVFVMETLRKLSPMVLSGKLPDLEYGLQLEIAHLATDESWPDWKKNNPRQVGFLNDANNELLAARKIILQSETSPSLALNRLQKANWKYVNKKTIEASLYGSVSLPTENQNTSSPDVNKASIVGGIIEWAKANPIPTIGIAGASVIGLLFIVGKPNNQKQMAAKKLPEKIALQGLK